MSNARFDSNLLSHQPFLGISSLVLAHHPDGRRDAKPLKNVAAAAPNPGQIALSKGARLGICFDEASHRPAESMRKEPT
jgi:hypothetical protein